MGKTQEPTAQELVELAKRAAHEAFACRFGSKRRGLNLLDTSWDGTSHYTLCATATDVFWTDAPDHSPGFLEDPSRAILMHTRLTESNTASESALVRALLRSRIEITTDDEGNFVASLGETEQSTHRGSSTLAELHLLDNLLATTEGHSR